MAYSAEMLSEEGCSTIVGDRWGVDGAEIAATVTSGSFFSASMSIVVVGAFPEAQRRCPTCGIRRLAAEVVV